ncbi:MAG: hypothetical protein ACXABK_04685, partial [Candidatus Heimdallarchaeaceae archaeon]
MNREELKQLLLDEEDIDKVKLLNIKDYHLAVEFLSDTDPLIRFNATKLLFGAEFIPTEKIIQEYLKEENKLIRDVIEKYLHHFIPALNEFLIKSDSFDPIFRILSNLQAKTIFKSISKASITTPVLASLSELSIRTCHSSLANYEESLIDFHFIEAHGKDIKKILAFRLKQILPIYTELTLLTITRFPELSYLMVKEIRDTITKSDIEEHIKYGSIA